MTFRTWLAGEMERQGLSRREVARRLAASHPQGVTPSTTETYRRAVRRYLDAEDPQSPTAQTRTAFAVALEVDPAEVPSSDDDEEEDLAAALQALAREQAEMSRRLNRVLKAAAVRS
jgi:transcriptional regulator with XRE-family HTH domain